MSEEENWLAKAMLDEARDKEFPNLFNCTGFSNSNISIVHQQIRCKNLAWALEKQGYLKSGNRVAIIGGGFSAMTLATSIALLNNVVVYILCENSRLLDDKLRKGDIYLSPSLNSLSLPLNYNPRYGHIDLPIFDWTADYTSTVCLQWIYRFKEISKYLPIFVLHNQFVARSDINLSNNKVIYTTKFEANIDFDLAVDATGFGTEKNPYKLIDHSYWDSGSRLTYSSRPLGERILVSGCGDSGIIEACRHAIDHFEHSDVLNIWEYGKRLESVVNEGLDNAFLKKEIYLTQDFEIEKLYLPEVYWYLNRKWILLANPNTSFDEVCDLTNLYSTLDAEICGNRVNRDYVHSNIDLLVEGDLELPDFLSLDHQYQIVRKVSGQLQEIISARMNVLANSIDIQKLPSFNELLKKTSKRTVILNGSTQSVFNASMSRMIFWITAILMHLPNVQYKKAKIESVSNRGRFPSLVTYSDGETESFDHVATRYGNEKTKFVSLSTRKFDKWGDFLLNDIPDYIGTKKHNEKLKFAIVDLPKRVSSKNKKLNKSLYITYHFLKSSDSSYELPKDPSSLHSEADLIKELKSGNQINFEEK